MLGGWRGLGYVNAANAPVSLFSHGTALFEASIRANTFPLGRGLFEKERAIHALNQFYSFQLLEYQWSEGEFDTLG